MIHGSANVLRVEAANTSHAIEDELRVALDEIQQDEAAKHELLTGETVALAEDIEVLRVIHTKLEGLVQLLEEERGAGAI